MRAGTIARFAAGKRVAGKKAAARSPGPANPSSLVGHDLRSYHYCRPTARRARAAM